MDVSRPLLEATLTSLLECATSRLDPAPERAVVVPGLTVPWDCEQVWVRLVQITPVYHQATTAAGGCGPLEWSLTVGVGAIRCVGVLDDRGNPPSVQRMLGDASLILSDAEALEQGIECCEMPWVQDMRITQYDSLGAEGSYAGGEWLVTFRITNCSDCSPT